MSETVKRRILQIQTDTLDNIQNTQLAFETDGVMSYYVNPSFKGVWGGKNADGYISRYATYDNVARFSKLYFPDNSPIIISPEYGDAEIYHDEENSATYRIDGSINIGLWSGKSISLNDTNRYPSINIGTGSGQTTHKYDFATYYPSMTPPSGYYGGGGSSVNLGFQAGLQSGQYNAVCIGVDSGSKSNLMDSVAIGSNSAGDTNASASIFIGKYSGNGKDYYSRYSWVNPSNQSLGVRRTPEEYGVYIGYSAGSLSREGTGNTCVGSESGSSARAFMNIDNPTVVDKGGYNTFVGYRSGHTSTSYKCSFIGMEAGVYAVGRENVGVGNNACANGGGSNNIAIGNGSYYNANGITYSGVSPMYGSSDLVGSYNIAIGEDSLANSDDVYGNISLGFGAGFNLTGNKNIFLGNFVAQNYTGNGNIFIGNNIAPTSAINNIEYTTQNNVIIGNGVNSLIVGNFDTQRVNFNKIVNITPADSTTITAPYSGDIVYDSVSNVPKYFDGGSWQTFDSGAGALVKGVEGGNTGYWLSEDRTKYANIGQGATDLSMSTLSGSTNGASGAASFACGQDTRAVGNYSHAEGLSTKANGNYSHAEGQGTTTISSWAHAEGRDTIASGTASHAEGLGTLAVGGSSHTEGTLTYVGTLGNSSHAEGYGTSAMNVYAHSEGYYAIASGDSSHAEGYYTIASGSYSHAEGLGSKATGYNSHAEGIGTSAIGTNSHAEGYYTVAGGTGSHAEGDGNIIPTSATNAAHVQGKWAIPLVYGQLSVIGNGGDDTTRSNAMVVWENGTIEAPSSSTSAINSRGSKTLITKQYADSTYSAISSQKYKNNIIDITDTSWIYDMRLVEFDYIEEFGGHKSYGVIAEEILPTHPELVKIIDDDPHSVRYEAMIAPLINELKKLRNRVEELESKL